MEHIKRDMYAVSVSDSETEATIKQVWEEHAVLLEPHGAVGWAGLMHYLDTHPEDTNRLCVSLETAHPAKFPEKINELLKLDPELPPSLQNLEGKDEYVISMPNDYQVFANYLKTNYK